MINYDIEKDKDIVKKYGINKVPAIKVIGKRENGITFYGIPSGYEFMSLVEAIENVSKDEAKLSKKTKEILSTINKQVHIQVFVTPTCPYCPLSVKLSHNMALESKYIKADMIEVLEFPELGEKYSVEGVPKTVINDKVELEGAYPEDHFIEHLLIATKDE
jgi:glutaredoxin-like protein